jgi:type VI secretion system protein ImpH
MTGWRNQSVRKRLYQEGYKFDFYQAVRVLKWLRPRSSAVCGTRPEAEPVRFASNVSFGFPASEIEGVSRLSIRKICAKCRIFRQPGLIRVVCENPEHNQQDTSLPRMTVNFMGLAGVHGSLPSPFAERVLQSARRKEHAFREFLDIFNHRLLSLLYRVKQNHRPALTTVTPDRGLVAQCLYSLLGLGFPALRDRQWVPDRALLFYAGLLSQRPRSATGLERLLSDYFNTDVAVQQFIGAWRQLSSDQWTRIGLRGHNQELGRGTVVGKRVWDQGGRILIKLGPMDLKKYKSFLPNGVAHEPLKQLTAFYLGKEFDFTFQLVLRQAEVPAAALCESRLGHAAWLRTQPQMPNAAEALLYPEA